MILTSLNVKITTDDAAKTNTAIIDAVVAVLTQIDRAKAIVANVPVVVKWERHEEGIKIRFDGTPDAIAEATRLLASQ
jgi:uncharacterized membrane protein